MYSIIIPAYNEAQRLAPTLDRILDYVAQQGWETEILVVNDGSKDETADVVRAYASHFPQVRLIENPGNRGKGYAVKNGMLHASGDIMLMCDADMSSPISEAPKLFRAVEGGADVAIGSRWIDPHLQDIRQPWYRQIGGRGLNLLIRLILGVNFKDTQCGFKAFSRQAVQTLFPLQQVERWGFDPELLFLAKRFGFRTDEIAVHWSNDERSKLHPFRDALRFLEDAFLVRRNAFNGKYGPASAAAAVASSR